MAGNTLNLAKERSLQIQEAVWTPNWVTLKKSNLTHTIVILWTNKNILKSETDREVPPCLQGETIHMTDFSSVNHGGHKEGAHKIFWMREERNCQPRNRYTAKISFRNEGEINLFSDEGKLRICCQETYSTRKAKGRCLNWKEMIK